MPTMHLAGYHVPPSDVLEVARLVDDHELAHRLETAYGTGARILALETVERSRFSAPSTTRRPRPSRSSALS